MMNWLKQVRMRCRVTRHQATALMPRRTGPIAAGTPIIAAVMMIRGASVVCPASSTQPMSRPPVTASSGSHHQMARSTGHAATMAAMMHAGTRPISPPVIRARMPAPVAPSFGSHLLTSTVAASRAVAAQMMKKTIFALRM